MPMSVSSSSPSWVEVSTVLARASRRTIGRADFDAARRATFP